ncbi:diaminopimelate epimerase [Virgibacillus oceani]|uniref:Diaminopimelate epimerase n=1 Tax=Virgibacillus oceani TaxID=1479511 RepID=A0A917LY08_9BACI|nr:diaminopimelate epimerase [Virgibacillus oceani]GGG66341.1 diaminopimelate epimerase [Virgibacillus oceani]
MKIPFTKMHGLGNNYIYLDLFQYEITEEMLPRLARKVSDVHTGIGADGLIVIHPSKQVDVGMRIFNKDGSEGKNCGNGLRCVAKYVYEQGIVQRDTFRIETKATIVDAEVHVIEGEVKDITINMGMPWLMRSDIPMRGDAGKVVAESFLVNDTELFITAVSMGNPHAIFFVESIEEAPLYELGPVIAKDERFPEGVNVEFVEIVSETEMNFRVWERGSGVTEACGTGACAAVVAAILNGYMMRDSKICVHLSGGDLMITWDSNGSVWMKGKAEIIASGFYYLN